MRLRRFGNLLLLCCTVASLLSFGRSQSSPDHIVELSAAASELWRVSIADGDCRDLSLAVLDPELELSPEELALLPFVCLPSEEYVSDGVSITRRGIPPGVDCTEVKWCDAEEQCSLVCARGSVAIPNWQSNAIVAQISAQADVPLCRASLLGTHNSAITMADGYGNLDPYWEGYFKYFKWALPAGKEPRMRTNNHWLSLTDQLRMGVRVLEIDTHWVGGALRVAHCGGLHVPQLNAIIKALNLVAKLLGRPIRWDTETMGCVPSLSSIPALEQRTLLDALLEIRAWMDSNPGLSVESPDPLILFFDDQADIGKWGLVPHFLADLRNGLDEAQIYRPADHEAWLRRKGVAPGLSSTTWPTPREMAQMGKRVVLVSGADYGPAMRDLIFAKHGGQVCAWNEPPLKEIRGTPFCDIIPGERAPSLSSAMQQHVALAATSRHLWDGTWTRAIACELEYGPLNCEFQWGTGNKPWLDAAGLANLAGCGLSIPSPDSLTPQRAAGALWGWAPAEPAPQRRLPRAPSLTGWIGTVLRVLWDLFGFARLQQEYDPAGCAAIEADSGRWVSTSCAQDLVTACRRQPAPNGTWWLESDWVLARGARGECPPGSVQDLPRHGVDNWHLARALALSGQSHAWLPLLGGQDEWRLDGLPMWAAS